MSPGTPGFAKSPAQRIRDDRQTRQAPVAALNVAAQAENDDEDDSSSESSSEDEDEDRPWKAGDTAIYSKHGRSEEVEITSIKKGGSKCKARNPSGKEVSVSTSRLTRPKRAGRGSKREAKPVEDSPQDADLIVVDAVPQVSKEDDLMEMLGFQHEAKKSTILGLYSAGTTKSSMS